MLTFACPKAKNSKSTGLGTIASKGTPALGPITRDLLFRFGVKQNVACQNSQQT